MLPSFTPSILNRILFTRSVITLLYKVNFVSLRVPINSIHLCSTAFPTTIGHQMNIFRNTVPFNNLMVTFYKSLPYSLFPSFLSFPCCFHITDFTLSIYPDPCALKEYIGVKVWYSLNFLLILIRQFIPPSLRIFQPPE